MLGSISILGSIGAIITAIIAILAFFGIYKYTDIPKRLKIHNSKKLIKSNPYAEFWSLRKTDIKEQWDKDYLIIGNKYYWIKNHETLSFVMKYNKYATDIDGRKNYKKLSDFNSFNRGFDLNII